MTPIERHIAVSLHMVGPFGRGRCDLLLFGDSVGYGDRKGSIVRVACRTLLYFVEELL